MFYIRVEAPDILWESIQEKYLGLKKQVTPDSVLKNRGRALLTTPGPYWDQRTRSIFNFFISYNDTLIPIFIVVSDDHCYL